LSQLNWSLFCRVLVYKLIFVIDVDNFVANNVFFFMENELMYVDNFDANKVFDFLFSLMMLCF
jgi:hypothetical protein